jgi:hypothetical protein
MAHSFHTNVMSEDQREFWFRWSFDIGNDRMNHYGFFGRKFKTINAEVEQILIFSR